MKKFFSLLFVALLSMSVWADTVVNVDFSAQGYNTGTNLNGVTLTIDGVSLTFDKADGSTAPTYYSNTSGSAVRLYGGNTMLVAASHNIKKIDFTFASGEDSNNILSDVGNYNIAGKQWTIGSSDPSMQVLFKIEGTSGHRRIHSLVITLEDDPVTELVDPVFSPVSGTTFTNSLEVTITCATQGAEIQYYEVVDGEIDWTTYQYYTGPFYINETKTFAAYASKSNESTDFVYATYTKVEQTVEAPVFDPAAGGFYNSINVKLTCATPGAVIYYSLDNEQWSQYVDPIPVTDDITIYAKAKAGDVESEVVSATYTKLPDTTVDVTFDARYDKGDGDTERHEYTVVKEPVTMYVGDGTVYEDHYRIYAGAEFYFESAGAPIISIEFHGMSNNTASNLSLAEGTTGTWTTGGTDGLWEGSAQHVQFNVNKQARFTTITVTLAGPTTLRGDVNGNGIVNMDDLTALINYLVFESPINHENAAICNSLDSNIVNMDDLTALINYLVYGKWDM